MLTIFCSLEPALFCANRFSSFVVNISGQAKKKWRIPLPSHGNKNIIKHVICGRKFYKKDANLFYEIVTGREFFSIHGIYRKCSLNLNQREPRISEPNGSS